MKIICDRYITISFQKKILNTVRHKNIVTAAVILVIALASFLLPIAAYSQLTYLLNTQLPEKNQGNQGRIMMLIDNVSNNSIVSIPRNAIGSSSKNNNNKVVIINFDDSHKSQYTYAKPTLDKYGFKATFFEVCNWIGTGHKSDMTMTWHDIAALHRDGMDIEPHTMTHAHLNTLSAAALNYEIGGSKQCFLNHGYNTTIFGYPVNSGSNMSSVVNIVAKYYSLARTGSDSLMYLHCNGYKEDSHQTDCRTYSADGKLTYANRYDIRSKSFDHISNSYIAYTPTQLFQQFVQRVNSQLQYNNNNNNKDGTINAVPIIVYHNLTYSDQVYNELPSTITVPLFAAEMKYLYDNGFKVLTINQLGYDTASNILYIKGGAHISNNNSLSSKTASKIVIAPLPHPTTTADCHTFISCL